MGFSHSAGGAPHTGLARSSTGRVLRAQGRNRDQFVHSRHAAPVRRYRSELFACSNARASLAAIDAAIKRIEERVRKSIGGSRTTLGVLRSESIATKLLVRAAGVQIKIEVTPVLRGSVYPAELRAVSSRVEAAFGFAEARLVSFPDIYGGKIVAALDRQQPRSVRCALSSTKRGHWGFFASRLHRLSR